MADATKSVALQSVFEATTDEQHAPIIYFDKAPIEGHLNGTIFLCLTALRHVPGEPGVVRAIPTVMAHLRTNIAGALALRDSIDGALKLAEQAVLAAEATPPDGLPN